MYADTMNRLQPIRMSEGKCPRLTEPSSHRVDAEGLELLCTLHTSRSKHWHNHFGRQQYLLKGTGSVSAEHNLPSYACPGVWSRADNAQGVKGAWPGKGIGLGESRVGPAFRRDRDKPGTSHQRLLATC